jgi:hypothetical protein
MAYFMNRQEFTQYLLDFYGPAGIYELDFTVQDIEQATAIYIARLKNQRCEFVGDSFDREKVRDIVVNEIRMEKRPVLA